MKFVAIYCLLLFACPLFAQEQKKDAPPIGYNQPEEKAAGTITIGGHKVEVMLVFTAGILLFGLLTIIFAYCLTVKGSMTEGNSVRLIGLVFLGTLAGSLVVGGYSQGQIATVMGLLGTLAGYVLGQRQTDQKPT